VQVPLGLGLQRFFGVKKNGTEPDAGGYIIFMLITKTK
jgi:hypothetical protein